MLRYKQIVLATGNKGKIKEFKDLLGPLHITGLSIYELDSQEILHVEEDGQTFVENALKKAQAFQQYFGLPALADDSGLEVDALHGEPGIYSARYAGEGKGDQANNEKLLKALQGLTQEERGAQFTCALVYVDGKNPHLIAEGHCRGLIVEQPAGTAGFGYDPIFFLPEKQKTMAQLPKWEKNKLSHRFQAMQHFIQQMRSGTY